MSEFRLMSDKEMMQWDEMRFMIKNKLSAKQQLIIANLYAQLYDKIPVVHCNRSAKWVNEIKAINNIYQLTNENIRNKIKPE